MDGTCLLDAGVRAGSRGSFGPTQDRPFVWAKGPNAKVSHFETHHASFDTYYPAIKFSIEKFPLGFLRKAECHLA